MTFDPTWPPSHVHASSAKFREQFNGLNDKIDAIPAGPPGPPGADGNDGADGATGPQGPQGDPGTFPLTGPAIITGRIISDNGDLSIVQQDANGSGETGLQLTSPQISGVPVFEITGRVNGTVIYSQRVDFGGQNGGGTPDRATLQFDDASKMWVTILGVTQNVVVSDGLGGFITLQITGGLITGVV